MSSGLLEPPAGDQLCALLLRGGAEGEEGRMREVGCQWESPDEEEGERAEQRKEVGCQSDAAEKRDAAVQVDLLTQQLSWRHTGSSQMLLQCFAVRPDGPDGGALLQHCTPNRTRTRNVQPAVKLSPEITPSRPRTTKRPPPNTTKRKRGRPRKHVSPEPEPEPELQQEEEEEGEEDGEGEEEGDTGDPTWSPPGTGAASPPVSQLASAARITAQMDGVSQHAPLHAVKLEPDSTMCDVCGKVMKNKASLVRHSFIHTGKKPFACHLCEMRFNRRDNLQHHLSRLHPNGVAKLEKQRDVQAWLCAVCGKTFNCRSRLKTHEAIHSGVKPHRCNLCPKAYMRTNDLEHHKKVVHVDGAVTPRPSLLLCDLCGKEFKSKSQLAVHFQSHTGERPHLCDICGRKFSRQYQLKRHKILVHINRVNGEESLPDSPFSCDVCGKRLKSEALLAAHTRIHSVDKPHRCGVCLRSYQSATCLKQHHARVHLRVKVNEGPRGLGERRRNPTESKEFPCPTCGKVFKFKSLLVSHALVHSEARPYACDFCSRSFRRLGHLKRHREVVHANGARPPQSFVCHICGKDKKCRSQLARHIVIHTGERPYACDLCPARFNRSGNLQQHRKRMHGVGAEPAEEAPPILFDDELMPALTYKQEETVVAVDAVAELCEAAAADEALQQLVNT